MAAHSSVLALRIPGTGKPCGLLSMGSHRVGHYWSDLAAAAVAVRNNRVRAYIPFTQFPRWYLHNYSAVSQSDHWHDYNLAILTIFHEFYMQLFVCIFNKMQFDIACIDSSNHFHCPNREEAHHQKDPSTVLLGPQVPSCLPIIISWKPLICPPSLNFGHFKTVI